MPLQQEEKEESAVAIYVLVHELAHMHSWSVGHTPEFHSSDIVT